MRELYVIPDRSCIEESIQLCRKYHAHFEYNDFFLPNLMDQPEKVKEIVDFYKGLNRDRSRDILHGAFLDVTVHSEDNKIYQVSALRVRQSMDIAVSLGIRGVVFHTNMIPNFKTPFYIRQWVDSNEAFWRQILKEYPKMEILIENMFDEDPHLLAQLAERMQDEERFGVCLDYAHAWCFGHGIGEWMEKLYPYVKHMHINDNDLKEDLHQSVGKGSIDWQQFDCFMKGGGADWSILIEVRAPKGQEESLEYMEKNGIYPFFGIQ